jgi:hypothetical protein
MSIPHHSYQARNVYISEHPKIYGDVKSDSKTIGQQVYWNLSGLVEMIFKVRQFYWNNNMVIIEGALYSIKSLVATLAEKKHVVILKNKKGVDVHKTVKLLKNKTVNVKLLKYLCEAATKVNPVTVGADTPKYLVEFIQDYADVAAAKAVETDVMVQESMVKLDAAAEQAVKEAAADERNIAECFLLQDRELLRDESFFYWNLVGVCARDAANVAAAMGACVIARNLVGVCARDAANVAAAMGACVIARNKVDAINFAPHAVEKIVQAGMFLATGRVLSDALCA